MGLSVIVVFGYEKYIWFLLCGWKDCWLYKEYGVSLVGENDLVGYGVVENNLLKMNLKIFK